MYIQTPDSSLDSVQTPTWALSRLTDTLHAYQVYILVVLCMLLAYVAGRDACWRPHEVPRTLMSDHVPPHTYLITPSGHAPPCKLDLRRPVAAVPAAASGGEMMARRAESGCVGVVNVAPSA